MTEEIRICLRSNRQDQLHKGNAYWRLQTLSIWPPIESGRPSATRKSGIPIWECTLLIRQSEDITVSLRENVCETIASEESDPRS